MIILEAAQHGIPTISTKVGGIPDFIRQNETGLFAEPDPQTFGNEINALLENESRRKQLGRKAEDLVRSSFTSSGFVEKHLEVYRWQNSQSE
jgi:glycosyltransferase involved in cell wall biosynthesis